jgi:type II secretory pathway pseudopilin PulG
MRSGKSLLEVLVVLVLVAGLAGLGLWAWRSAFDQARRLDDATKRATGHVRHNLKNDVRPRIKYLPGQK